MIDYYPYLNMTRTQLVKSMNREPDYIGGCSRKYKTPNVYRYKNIEFVFEPYKNGKCN